MFNETSYGRGLSGANIKAKKAANDSSPGIMPFKPYMPENPPAPSPAPAPDTQPQGPAGGSVFDSLKSVPTMYWLIGAGVLFFVMGKR